MVVLTLWCMVSHLKGMEKVDDSQINVAQRLIHIFLTALAQHDKLASLVNTRPVPMFISQYNFMSLLNIPEQLGWEGGVWGEGFFRTLGTYRCQGK